MVFRGSPVRRASSRSTGPEVRWRKLQKGVNPRRASARRSFRRIGAQVPARRANGRANGLSEGARLRSGRSGRVPASPETRAVVESARGATRVKTRRPSVRAGSCVLSRWSRSWASCPRRGSESSAQRKPSRRACVSAPESRSSSNPQGSNGRRRGGTALREGKALQGEPQGRLRHETRPRSFRAGVISSGRGATRVERGDVAQTVEGLRKPEGGTGEGLAILTSRGRRSRRSWQHGGTWSACVVGAKNPRRGDTRSDGESRR